MSFLQSLTSQKGKNLITGPHKTRTMKNGSPLWIEKWVDFSDDKATQAAVDFVEEQCTGTYFALGSFKQGENNRYRRRAMYCTHLKAFWLDIDCGEEKWQKHAGVGVYRTREHGQVALSDFIAKSTLPAPTYIVSSGAGYHVYWVLDRELPTDRWRECALVFKALCTKLGFQADPARTADAASVLRVPGTYHHSGAIVDVIHTETLISADYIQAVFDGLKGFVADVISPVATRTTLDIGPTPDYLDGETSTLDAQELNTPKKFANIIARSELENSGCNQLYQMYLNQETVPEPMWSAALSIAKFCIDGEEWAIKISENHPEFDPYATVRKMNQWSAPRTCAWFSENNPSECVGCPHFNKIKERPTQSPIILGIDERVPTVVKAPIAGSNADEEHEEEFIIPSYPFPFYRHPNGGVWIQHEEDGERIDRMVYDFDLYIYDRIGMGADNRPRFWARQHTPHDGVNELELSSDDLFGPANNLPLKLAAHNILLPPEINTSDLYKYLRSQAAQLQRTRAMTKPPRQLGWTDKGSFVLGKWEFTKGGRKMSPIPDTNIARNFAESCELRRDAFKQVDNWNRSLETLYGSDDAEVYRLILAMGFGAPVRAKYGSEVGGVVNIYSEDSGFGKTTLTKVIAGIFGQSADPFVLQAQHGTTVTAFFEIISYVNSIPLTLDETGQMDIDSLMAFVHTCTSGKSKARGSHQTNDIRQALPGWKTHVFSSSNVSLWNRITEARAENEAYLMRILEIPVRALAQSKDKNYGDKAVREIQKHYGVAGPVFLDYILQNEHEIEPLWNDVSEKITTVCKLHGRHRFWGDIMTSAVVGAKLAHDAGVFPFNPREAFKTACNLLIRLVERAESKVVKEIDLFGEMFNHFVEATIVVKNSIESTAAIKTPLRHAYIRIELDDKRLFIDNVVLREFARIRGFGIERLEMALEEMGGVRGTMKRMWSNTNLQTANPPVRTWFVDLNSPKAKQIINPEVYYADNGDTGTSGSQA